MDIDINKTPKKLNNSSPTIIYIYTSYTDAQKKAIQKYQNEHKDELTIKRKQHRSTEEYKKNHREYMRKYYAENKEKINSQRRKKNNNIQTTN